MICGHRYSTGTHWNLDSVTCGRGSGTVLAQTGRRKIISNSQVHDTATTVEATSISTTSQNNAPQAMAPVEKLRKFVGIDFKRWQQKMFFYFTTLCPQRNYILSGLQDDLYNVHSGTKIAKEFWGALEWKYKIENAGTKKFFIARFLEYKMIDNKSVSPKCRNCK
ncbi:hypothetical protein T459_03142 [Capsicum annuum]|uniref:Uncharacterized protein n=1 Tax=Capsicum annuum TaxID=4072 RepID=A0A2G3AM17_CAPAN|nr:hypothetical protein T459_03142 [Capsicum annuum]